MREKPVHRLYDLADRLWDVFDDVVDAHRRERIPALGRRADDEPLTLVDRDPF